MSSIFDLQNLSKKYEICYFSAPPCEKLNNIYKLITDGELPPTQFIIDINTHKIHPLNIPSIVLIFLLTSPKYGINILSGKVTRTDIPLTFSLPYLLDNYNWIHCGDEWRKSGMSNNVETEITNRLQAVIDLDLTLKETCASQNMVDDLVNLYN